MCPNRKAFTLVEMLVALAVSSIVIIAAYASYDMVKTQYEKNIGIADMHTSGRAVMRIIERDIRMAGYEHQDSLGDKSFSAGITNKLVLTESDNACCDGVSVIYDQPTDIEDGVERRRITYSVREFPGTEEVGYEILDSDVARYRLYKKIDVLGTDGTIFPTEESGSDQVLADFVEDFQLFNIEKSLGLYSGDRYSSRIGVYNDSLDLIDGFRLSGISRSGALAFDSNGKLYVGDANSNRVAIYNLTTKSTDIISATSIASFYDLEFGPDNKLYGSDRAYGGNIWVYDPVSRTSEIFRVGGISLATGIAFDSSGQMYVGDYYNNRIAILTGASMSTRFVDMSSTAFRPGDLEFSPDNKLYVSDRNRTTNIWTYDPSTESENMFSFSGFSRLSGIAFDINGELYVGGYYGNHIGVYDPITATNWGRVVGGITRPSDLEFRSKITGKESLVNIKLTLRSKNKQHTADKTYTKEVDEEHHIGNYNFEFNDKYKRDVFFSTVAVRNMLL